MKSIAHISKSAACVYGFLIILAMVIISERLHPFLSAPGRSYVIEARKDGFYPQKIDIKEGDTLIFSSKIERSIWPASDPHPTHSAYSGFDPQRPINPGDTWSFTFNKAGIWGFHDHLAPSFTGTVVVTSTESAEDIALAEDCVRLNLMASDTCFNEQLRQTVRVKGVDAAFDLLAHRYDIGNVPAACHWSAHKIGEEAYQQEKKGRPWTFTAETYYCGYGFYHGYLEVMLREDPSPAKQKEKVVAFCDAAQKQLGGEARDNCYHGIGSGYTENPPTPLAWGKPELIVKPGLAICEQLFGDTREWQMCTTGVYAVLANFMSDRQYDFSFDRKDPLAFCATQEERYHDACYGEFSPKLGAVFGDSIRTLAEYVKTKNLTDERVMKKIVNVGVSSIMQVKTLESDQTALIADCRTFSTSLQPLCLDGVVWGLLYNGRINEEEVKAIKFCDSGSLSDPEKNFCYQRIVARAKNMYSADRFMAICKELSSEYRHYCQEDTIVEL